MSSLTLIGSRLFPIYGTFICIFSGRPFAFDGDMGGLVKARRIFFRKPLDCFQAYTLWEFFQCRKFFPKVFPCKSFFSPSNPVCGIINHIPSPSPQKSNGMMAGSDLWWLVRLSTRRCKRTSPVSAEKKKEFPLVVLNCIDNNRQPFLLFSLWWFGSLGRGGGGYSL